MRLLAIETSGPACSVAAWDGGAALPPPAAADGRARLRGHRRRELGRGHAEALLPMVVEALDEAGWDFADLDALAVNRGPGSFTGIRVGVAAARGLALAAGLPVVGVGGLEALAAATAAAPAAAVVAVLDARRGQVYAQAFTAAARPLEPLDEPRAIEPAAAAVAAAGLPRPLVIVGSGAALVRSHLPAADGDVVVRDDVPLDAAAVAALAAARLSRQGAGAAGHGFDLVPLYLRPPDARPQIPVVAPRATADVLGPAPAAGA